VRLLQSMRPLTIAEEEEIKRQRKLIKNREYAQTSRIKKRETLSSLQVQFTAVNTENSILKSHITNLSQQVQYLQVENHQLRMLLSSYSLSPTPAMVVPTIPPPQAYTPNPTLQHSPDSIYSDSYSPSHSDENDLLGVITSDSDDLAIDFTQDKGLGINQYDQYSYLPGKNWVSDNYTTGLCLFLILFSFGIFFNGVLLPGISVMVAPSLAGANPTTGRTLSTANEIYIDNENFDPTQDIMDSMSGLDLSSTEPIDGCCNDTLEDSEKEDNEREEIQKVLVNNYRVVDPYLTPYL